MSRFYQNVIARQSGQVIEITKDMTVVDNTATTVVPDITTTVVDDSATTVVAEPTTTVPMPLWVSESGDIFPASRVRRIERAQDALTHAEECVYDYLWGPKTTAKDEYRIAQVGYDRIAKASRITKRNAALIVERLIKKGYVRLEHEADHLHRIAKQYRVLGYRAALDELSRRGRLWVVKSGNGLLFVSQKTIVVESATTVVAIPTTTVVDNIPTTVVTSIPTTVVADGQTTVVAATTPIRHKEETKETRQSSSLALVEVCRKHGVLLDAAAERVIPKRCRTYDPAATDEEIAHFAEGKILQLKKSRNVGNLVGLLMTAVPEFFVEPATEVRQYRADVAKHSAREEQAVAERRELARKILDDPHASQQEKDWAREIPGTRSQPSGGDAAEGESDPNK